jgi:hypothetical protein
MWHSMRNSFQSIFLPTGITRNHGIFILTASLLLSVFPHIKCEASLPMSTKFGMNFLPLEAVMAPYFLTSDMAACICEVGETLAFACVLVLRWCVVIQAGKMCSLWEDDDVVHCEVAIWRSCGIFFCFWCDSGYKWTLELSMYIQSADRSRTYLNLVCWKYMVMERNV